MASSATARSSKHDPPPEAPPAGPPRRAAKETAMKQTLILLGVIAALVLALVVFGPAACQKLRSQADQSRLDRGEAGAFANSAGDAINTHSQANQRERASEDVGRANEKEIRDAQAK